MPSKRKSKRKTKRKSKRSRVRIPIKPSGSLTKHGYSTKSLAKDRRKSLKKAVNSLMRTKRRTRHDSAVTVVRRLSALKTLNKKKKKLYNIFNNDAKWIRKTLY